jgi:hypothetical protein
MIKNLQEKDYVYIPGGENQEAVSNLINNLNKKTVQLENDYKNKINNIQDTIYSHQKDDIELNKMFQNQKKLENHDKNIALVFSYLDEMTEKEESKKPRTKIGYKK